MPPTFEILSLASIAYSGFNSRPIYLRLFNLATSPVVPVPMKGSITAKQDFVEYMNELHSCVVTKREHGMLSLSSISGKYDFEMFESGNDHWEIIK